MLVVRSSKLLYFFITGSWLRVNLLLPLFKVFPQKSLTSFVLWLIPFIMSSQRSDFTQFLSSLSIADDNKVRLLRYPGILDTWKLLELNNRVPGTFIRRKLRTAELVGSLYKRGDANRNFPTSFSHWSKFSGEFLPLIKKFWWLSPSNKNFPTSFFHW